MEYFTFDFNTVQFLFLHPETASIVAPFNVLISPRFQRVTEGDRVEFRCTADGTPIPDLRWTRGRNNQLSLEAIIEDGVFIIPEVSRTDEDEYFCEAFNAGGMSTTRTILYVEGIFNFSLFIVYTVKVEQITSII